MLYRRLRGLPAGLLCVLLPGLLLPGCGGNQTPHSDTSADVRIGVNADFEPFEYEDSQGQLTGFDIELVEDICCRAGWNCEFVKLPLAELLPSVAEHQVDMAVGAISITPGRQAVVSFSDPYYISWQAITVLERDTVVHSLSDLRGKRVGVLAGTSSEILAKDPDGLLVFPFATVEDAFEALDEHRIDAVLNDYPSSELYARRHKRLRLVPDHALLEFYGIALSVTDHKRLEQVNRILAEIMGDGTIDSLHVHWFGEPLLADVDPPDSVEAASRTERP